MKLDAKKVVFSRPISLYEAALIYSSITNEYAEDPSSNNYYYYVGIDSIANVFIESLPSVEVEWVSKEMNITNRESVIMLCEYPNFYELLKDHLYNCGINGYKRYSVFTKSDLIGDNDRTWEDFIGYSEEEAMVFYKDILMIKDIISVIKHDDEEEA